jgi:hypothetical protein
VSTLRTGFARCILVGHGAFSGVAAGAMLLSLAMTGYLLYYLGDDAQRLAASIAHWTMGLAAPVFWHCMSGSAGALGRSICRWSQA